MKRFYQDKTYIFFLIILLTVSYLRSPDIFNDGRFWGEDGVIYFQNAIKNSFFDNFFQIYTPTSGYYNLFPRIVALISSKFSLEIAPLANNYLSYVVIFYIFCLILFNNSFLYENKKEKLVCCCLVLLCPTLVPEIWLTSNNAQTYFGISTLFILYLKDETNFIFKFLNRLTLFIGGLSGVYVLAFTPFYFLKYILFQNRNNLINLIVLSLTLLFQLSFYIYSKINNLMIMRDVNFDLHYLAVFFYNTVAKLFFPKEVIHFLYNLFINNMITSLGICLIFIIIFAYIVLESAKILIRNEKQLIVTSSLISIFILLISITFIFSGEYFAGRYSAVPGFVLAIIILNLTFFKRKNLFLKNVYLILSFLIIISGIYNYRPINDYRIQYLDCINNCTKWKDQIKEFRSDKSNNEILVWPYNSEDKLDKFEYQNIMIIDQTSL